MVTERGQDSYVLAVAAAGGDAGRALVHVKEAFAEQGPEPTVPAADLATLTRLELDGALTATQAKQVLAEIVDRRRWGRRQRSRRRRASRRWTRPSSSRWSTRRSPPSPTPGRSSAPARARPLGALVGAVMKASKGQADGKAVTALLDARRAT